MAGSPAPTASSEGFTDAQKSELSAMIAEAVKSNTAPPKEDQPKGAPTVTDEEWAGMSDRKRENFITQVVDARLDELARLDADAERDRKIADLEKKNGQPLPEKAPSVWTKLQGFLWGAADA
jgi:hypothetical protein